MRERRDPSRRAADGPRASAGFGVVWALATVGIAAVVVLATLPSTRQLGGAPYLLLAALALAALAIAIEARLDLFRGLRGTFVLLVLAAAVTALAGVWVPSSPHPLAVAVVIGCALVALPSGAYVWWTQRRPSRALNRLRALRADDRAICEVDGVQLAVAHRGEAQAGDVFELELWIQSCWDAPREVTIALAADDALFARIQRRMDPVTFDALVFPAPRTIPLPPLGSGRLRLAVAIDPRARGWLTISPRVSVRGEGGARVLHWRSPRSVHRVPDWLTALAALGDAALVGGGLDVDVRVRPSSSTATSTATPSRDELTAATEWLTPLE